MEKIILDNGMPLLTYKFPKANTVAFSFAVKIGSVFEEKDKRGISHLLEHMMFKTNQKYEGKEINKIIELSGGLVNAFTGRDATAFLFEVVPEGFERALDVFYHMFINPKFKEDEFKNEKEVVKSEITIYESNPSYKIEDLVYKALYGESDFGEPVAGTIETVNNITKEDLEEYKANYYTTDNTILFLAGNFNEKHIELINKTFGRIEESKSKRKKEPTINEGKDITEKMETNNAFAAVASNYKFKKEEIYHLIALKPLISGGLSSLLFNELRENYGLAYSIYLEQDYFFNLNTAQYIVFDGLNVDKLDIYVEKTKEVLLNRLKNLEKSYIEGRKRFYKILTKNLDTDMFSFLEEEVFYQAKGLVSYLDVKNHIENNLETSFDWLKDNIDNIFDKIKVTQILPKNL